MACTPYLHTLARPSYPAPARTKQDWGLSSHHGPQERGGHRHGEPQRETTSPRETTVKCPSLVYPER